MESRVIHEKLPIKRARTGPTCHVSPVTLSLVTDEFAFMANSSTLARLAYKTDNGTFVICFHDLYFTSRHFCVILHNFRITGADQHLYIVTTGSHVLHRFTNLDQRVLLFHSSHIKLHFALPRPCFFAAIPQKADMELNVKRGTPGRWRILENRKSVGPPRPSCSKGPPRRQYLFFAGFILFYDALPQ